MRALIAALLLTFAVDQALCDDKIVIGYTPTSVNTLVFVAQKKGYFAERGVQVELQPMRSANVIVPSILANSIQAGTLTLPSIIQAADGGINMMAVGGLSALSNSIKDTSLIARVGSNLKTAGDLKGKKLAVGTIGNISHVMVVKWLMMHGVDPESITFVEAGFGEMPDLIKGGNIDAVFLPEPLASAILKAGSGTLIAHVTDELPDGLVAVISGFAAEWTFKHPKETKAYLAAIGDAQRFAAEQANEGELRSIVGEQLKLKPEIMAASPIPKLVADVGSLDAKWWIDVMNEEKLLRTQIDPDKLIYRP